MKVEHTSRGFAVARGTDRYGAPFSIQDSSIAGEACIWLGSDSDDAGRAHLTQADAAALIPLLAAFVEGGSIAADDSTPKPTADIICDSTNAASPIDATTIVRVNAFLSHMADHYRLRTRYRRFGITLRQMSRVDAMTLALATFDASQDMTGVAFGDSDYPWDRDHAHELVDEDLQHWEA